MLPQKNDTYLLIFSEMVGLKVKTHRQKISWYWIWKLSFPDSSETSLQIESLVESN